MKPLSKIIYNHSGYYIHQKIKERIHFDGFLFHYVMEKTKILVEDQCILIDGKALWLSSVLLDYLVERGF